MTSSKCCQNLVTLISRPRNFSIVIFFGNLKKSILNFIFQIGKFAGDVFLTSRSEERGLAAIEELKKVLFYCHQGSFTNDITII